MNKITFIILIFSLYTTNIQGKNIYVSLQGNDKNNGNIETPFKSIARAINEAKKSYESDTIFIREGEYAQYKSLKFDKTANIVLQAYKNEKVSITGCISFSDKHVHKITNENINKKLKNSIRNKIRYINCNDFNIKLTGIFPKIFNSNPSPSWNELFVDKIPLQISRWPNDKMNQLTKVYNTGNTISKNITNKGNAIIGYIDTIPDFWCDVNNAWISGYFGEGWADERLPLKSINKNNKTLTIEGGSYYGFKNKGTYNRWYICNLLEEIDKPGEYVIDTLSNHIYFYPNSSCINNYSISTLTNEIISIERCHNILIKNINIECSCGMGVNVKRSNNIIIDNCIIRNLGHIGVQINAIDSHDNGIQNCEIYNTANGGIILNGGDIKTLVKGMNYIKNCKIYKYNRIERSYRPAIKLMGVGNLVSQVEIHDAPSMAISIDGNYHTIEYVDIHHVCQEIHDQGAIYYGRNPTERGHIIKYSYFHDIQSPFDVRAIYHDDGACGMKVHGCIFNNISATPIQIGGGQDITYTNNIFMNLPSAITIDARLKTWANKWLQPGGEYDKKFKAVNYDQPPFSKVFPELLNYWNDDPTTPKRNIIENNVFYNVNKLIKGNMEYLDWGNNWETNKNPGLKNTNNPLEGIDYRIIKQHLPKFHEIQLDSIGCHL